MNKRLFFFRIFFLFSFYLLISCRGKSHVSLPEGIVPPDTMAEILVDVHILQAAAQLGYTMNPKDTNSTMAYQSLWKKHNLTEKSYRENMHFYSDRPKLLDSVYEKVQSRLNQQKAELMGPKAGPVK